MLGKSTDVDPLVASVVTVFSAVQSPQIELSADSAYWISYPVIAFAAPAAAPDHYNVGAVSASVGETDADDGAVQLVYDV